MKEKNNIILLEGYYTYPELVELTTADLKGLSSYDRFKANVIAVHCLAQGKVKILKNRFTGHGGIIEKHEWDNLKFPQSVIGKFENFYDEEVFI
jgi:hypothetical protein